MPTAFPSEDSSDLVKRAFSFAYAAHEGERSRGETRIEHPVAVARLIIGEHAGDDIVAAALLHDVLEDTTVGEDELADAFGPSIAWLVAQLSEDPAIESYAERKRELRLQVARAGEDASMIFLADKLARLNALGRDVSALPALRLEHYRETVELLARRYPNLPFIVELEEIL